MHYWVVPVATNLPYSISSHHETTFGAPCVNWEEIAYRYQLDVIIYHTMALKQVESVAFLTSIFFLRDDIKISLEQNAEVPSSLKSHVG